MTNSEIQYMESGIDSVESRIQDCNGFPVVIWDDLKLLLEIQRNKEVKWDVNII